MGAVSPRPILLKSPVASPGKEANDDGNEHSQQRPITRLSVSKSYTIPPRPKPGRKPNNEIPPSRRKAQNREAQRAFRERKSQAVRALEQQLAQQARAFERQQEQMKEQILMLQRQNMQLQYSPTSPQSPQSPGSSPIPPVIQPMSQTPSQQSSSQQPQVQQPTTQQFSVRQPSYQNSPAQNTSTQNASIQIPSIQKPSTGSPRSSTNHISPHHSPQSFPQSPNSPFGTPVTPADVVGLELLDHVLEQRLPTSSTSSSSSPSESPHRSRRLSAARDVARTDPPPTRSPLDLVNTSWSQPAVPLRRPSRPLEMDFTAAFTPREPRPLQIRSPPAPKDRCGFCTDNSPCICAATAAREEGVSSELAPDLGTLGSPGSSFSGFLLSSGSTPSTPPQSNTSALAPAALASNTLASTASSGSGECTGNPGSCSQCRQDPMLTLFCSAVSSKPISSFLSPYSTYIPAQAAYKTLSRHPRFGYADLGVIVDVLQVRSSQVEVNSVAKALRILDTK